MWSLIALLLVWITGCSLGGRPIPESGSPAYVPPTWRERQIAFRQTWDRLLSERTEREAQAMRDQEVEAREDALRQLPFVSLAAGGHTTLAEAITLLLSGTPYSAVYGPYVDSTLPLATYIAHQRLDRAMATLVHPLGYSAQVDPGERQVHIDALLTRRWSLPALPVTDQAFWDTLGEDLQRLVDSGPDQSPSPGFVSLNPQAGEVIVSARVVQMPYIEAHMAQVATRARDSAEAP